MSNYYDRSMEKGIGLSKQHWGTDLSKAFDCLNHDLFIAKLDDYGFEKNAINFIYDCLKERKQRTKVNNSYTFWKIYTVWGTPGVYSRTTVIQYFYKRYIFLYKENKNCKLCGRQYHIYLNEMKSNDDKCHLIVANQENISIALGNQCIEAEDSVELLGIKIDKKT